MELYLMQHGACLSKEEDPEQPLSAEGREQIRNAAAALQKLGVRVDVVVASSKKRSLQTAAIVAETLGVPPDAVAQTDLAKPMAPPEETVRFLSGYTDRNAVLVAGHLPSLAEIAAFLLSEEGKPSVAFTQGGVARIDVERLPTRSGTLRWLLTPDQVRRIAA